MFIYLFLRERERERARASGGGAESKRENLKQVPTVSAEPGAGLKPMTVRS